MVRAFADRTVAIVALLALVGGGARGAEAPDEPTVELAAGEAEIHGDTARFLVLEGIGTICYWTDPADWLSWDFSLKRPGDYVVDLKYSCDPGSQGSTFQVTLGDSKLECRIAEATGSWYDHGTMKLGSVTVSRAGEQRLTLKPTGKPGQAVMNLAWIRLVPAAGYAEYEARRKGRELGWKGESTGPVLVVPNFHPASCGWLTDFSTERNYCAYSYLAHLDRVRDDPAYCFALSEVNTIMAMMEFEPERVTELKQRIAEGRVELANAFFLEPTINISGGEALVKMGVEGLRWQRSVLGARPRLAWMIDVTGVHEQMAQIVSGLGLGGIVYTRSNPTRSTLHGFESPDGTRALAICPGHYSEWGPVFSTQAPLSSDAIQRLVSDARAKARRTPAGAPVLILGGAGDYSLPPARAEYPTELLHQWKGVAPDIELRFTGPGTFLDDVRSRIHFDAIELPVVRSGTQLTWSSFWIQNPTVKTWYRRAEHGLQAAEALATLASLSADCDYPVQPLYHAWLQMLLNMDRNTLWGAAGGMVFEHPRSWDVQDRFESVERISSSTQARAMRSLLGNGRGIGLFNPLNWRRTDPFTLRLPRWTRIAGARSQRIDPETVVCHVPLPSLGAVGLELEPEPEAPTPKPYKVTEPLRVETGHYEAVVDPATGCLSALKLRPSGRVILGGPVAWVAEEGLDGHNTKPRPERRRLADSGDFPTDVFVTEGPVATIVESTAGFYGGARIRRTVTLYREHPRIDIDTELTDVPHGAVVTAEVPLANPVAEVRRGIPYGFSHSGWSKPDPRLAGLNEGIVAAVRWTHYQLEGGGGVAILDRGLPGRELSGQTAVIFLLNAQDSYLGYPCAWLSGKGTHRSSFALVAHDGDWKDARIPQLAWELNSPPVVAVDVRGQGMSSVAETSDNVIVQAVRREGAAVEVRLAECLGNASDAWISIALPHRKAFRTDLLGERARPLAGGPRYELRLRPQEIVTLRLETADAVEAIVPLLKWDALVPPSKLDALQRKLPGVKGHPPRGPGLSEAVPPKLPDDAATSLTAGKRATASNVYRGMAAHGAAMAVDGNPNTRWATDGSAGEAVLEVDLEKPERVARAFLSEAYDRVRKFEIQYEEGGEWKTAARGGAIGPERELRFDAFTARKVRLRILDAPGGPTLWEFLLFPPQP